MVPEPGSGGEPLKIQSGNTTHEKSDSRPEEIDSNSPLFSKEGLQPVTTALGALFLLAALSHGLFEAYTEFSTARIVAVVAACNLLVFGLLLGRWAVPNNWGYRVGAVLGGLVVLNSFVHLYLFADANQTTNLFLLFLGGACFIFSSNRLIALLVFSLAHWLAMAWLAGPSGGWLYFALGLFVASAFRFHSEFRKRELHEALNSLKSTMASLKDAMQVQEKEILEREKVEHELRESRERLALASNGANHGLWDWNLKTGEIYFSPHWARMLGLSPEELRNDPEEWFSRIHPEDLESLKLSIDDHIKGRQPHLEQEFRIRHQDDHYIWMHCRGMAVQDENNKAYRIAGSQTEITERKLAEQKMLHNAIHDSLTGLPNRTHFLGRLSRALKRAEVDLTFKFAVLFVDLDRFKIVNDSLGHILGDELLVATAGRLTTCLRIEKTDTVARLGGDEFVILLEELRDVSDATRIAERIQKELQYPFTLDGRSVFVTATIGIVISGPQYKHPEELLRDADTALYRAKSNGKAHYQLFDAEMHAQAIDLLQVENDLRRAVDRREFAVHYQPIVSLDSGNVAGFEALVRWNHPVKNLVLPGTFLPIAEETGLIIPIDWWVLDEACRKLLAWQSLFHKNPPLAVSVNLSSRQFSLPGLVDQVKSILKDTGFDPHNLRLEVTESVLIENTDLALKTLLELRNLGIRLYLDDFGTGYSSLSYLHRFPFDASKIDRSFMSTMTGPNPNPQIIRSIITLAHSLGMDVVAEGVETPEQAEKLSEMGCDYAQGFYYSKPLDALSAERLLDRGLRLGMPIETVSKMSAIRRVV